MVRVRCTIVVELEDNVWKEQGYETLEDYLNDCRFNVYDHKHDDICTDVEDYEKIGDWFQISGWNIPLLLFLNFSKTE